MGVFTVSGTYSGCSFMHNPLTKRNEKDRLGIRIIPDFAWWVWSGGVGRYYVTAVVGRQRRGRAGRVGCGGGLVAGQTEWRVQRGVRHQHGEPDGAADLIE